MHKTIRQQSAKYCYKANTQSMMRCTKMIAILKSMAICLNPRRRAAMSKFAQISDAEIKEILAIASLIN